MVLNRSGATWDRTERNKLNENWDILEQFMRNSPNGIAQEIIDARGGFNSLKENLDDIRNKTLSKINNGVYNGNFEGIDGWTSTATISATDNKLIITSGVSTGIVRANQRTENALLDYKRGNKYYISGKLSVDNNQANDIRLVLYGSSTTGTLREVKIENPSLNEIYQLSDVLTLPNDGEGKIITQIRTSYSSGISGRITQAEKVILLNLTDIFGEGNEPDKYFMDDFIKSLPNKYLESDSNLSDVMVAILNMMMSGSTQSSNVLDIKNEITNGNFDTTAGWNSLSGTTMTASNNTLILTGNGNKLVRSYQDTDIPFYIGDKIYLRGDFTLDNDNCKRAGFYLTTSGARGTNTEFIMQTAPKKDVKYTLSQIVEMWDTVGAGNLSVYPRADYDSSAASNGKVLKVNKVMVLNLTKIFGAGNEPNDSAKIDEIINKYPNRFFENKPSNDEWEKAEKSATLSFNYPPKIPLIVFGIDDGNLTDYTTAWSLFKSKGIKGSSYLVNKWVGSDDTRWLNAQQIQEMYEEGWDFQCHTANHSHFQEYATDQEIRDEFLINNQMFKDLGLPQPEHHVYPFGDYNRRVIDIGLEYRKTLRATGDTSGRWFNQYGQVNLGALNARSIDITASETERINEIKRAIDDNVRNRGVLILYMHQIKDVPDGDYMAQTSVVSDIIDHAKQYIDRGHLRSVTHKEACDYLYRWN